MLIAVVRHTAIALHSPSLDQIRHSATHANAPALWPRKPTGAHSLSPRSQPPNQSHRLTTEPSRSLPSQPHRTHTHAKQHRLLHPQPRPPHAQLSIPESARTREALEHSHTNAHQQNTRQHSALAQPVHGPAHARATQRCKHGSELHAQHPGPAAGDLVLGPFGQGEHVR